MFHTALTADAKTETPTIDLTVFTAARAEIASIHDMAPARRDLILSKLFDEKILFQILNNDVLDIKRLNQFIAAFKEQNKIHNFKYTKIKKSIALAKETFDALSKHLDDLITAFSPKLSEVDQALNAIEAITKKIMSLNFDSPLPIVDHFNRTQLCDAFIKKYPDHPNLSLYLDLIRYDYSHLFLGVKLLQPKERDAMSELETIENALKQFNQALTPKEPAEKKEVAMTLYREATAQLAEEKYFETLFICNQALLLNPDLFDLHLLRAKAFIGVNAFTQAHRDLINCLTFEDPTLDAMADIHASFHQIYTALDKKDLAAKAFSYQQGYKRLSQKNDDPDQKEIIASQELPHLDLKSDTKTKTGFEVALPGPRKQRIAFKGKTRSARPKPQTAAGEAKSDSSPSLSATPITYLEQQPKQKLTITLSLTPEVTMLQQPDIDIKHTVNITPPPMSLLELQIRRMKFLLPRILEETLQNLFEKESKDQVILVKGSFIRKQILNKIHGLTLSPNDYDVILTTERNKVMLFIKPILERHTLKMYESKYSFGNNLGYLSLGSPQNKRIDLVTGCKNPEDLTFEHSDFTISSIAYNPATGEIILKNADLVLTDFENKIVRANPINHQFTPELNFQEDPLRILRGIDLCTEMDGTIEEKTEQAMISCGHLLRHKTYDEKSKNRPEKINTQLEKLFFNGRAIANFDLMQKLNLIKHLFPGLDKEKDISCIREMLADIDSLIKHNVANIDRNLLPSFTELYAMLIVCTTPAKLHLMSDHPDAVTNRWNHALENNALFAAKLTKVKNQPIYEKAIQLAIRKREEYELQNYPQYQQLKQQHLEQQNQLEQIQQQYDEAEAIQQQQEFQLYQQHLRNEYLLQQLHQQQLAQQNLIQQLNAQQQTIYQLQTTPIVVYPSLANNGAGPTLFRSPTPSTGTLPPTPRNGFQPT